MGSVTDSPLGQASVYVDHYDASLLFAIPRSEARSRIGLEDKLPFTGEDVWNAYELSWLNQRGLPQVAIAELRVPCESESLVESKSLKLYLNGFANSRFAEPAQVQARIAGDLSRLLAVPVSVRLRGLDEPFEPMPAGICIDQQDVEVDCYEVNPALLQVGDGMVTERLYSNLLRSRCPVTGQPDWATLSIDYTGVAIQRDALLRYLVSFRNHQGFHEQLVEQIFADLWRECQPLALTVYGRFTRRGGIDINPWRSSVAGAASNWREPRQ